MTQTSCCIVNYLLRSFSVCPSTTPSHTHIVLYPWVYIPAHRDMYDIYVCVFRRYSHIQTVHLRSAIFLHLSFPLLLPLWASSFFLYVNVIGMCVHVRVCVSHPLRSDPPSFSSSASSPLLTPCRFALAVMQAGSGLIIQRHLFILAGFP